MQQIEVECDKSATVALLVFPARRGRWRRGVCEVHQARSCRSWFSGSWPLSRICWPSGCGDRTPAEIKRFLHPSRNTFFPALRVPPHKPCAAEAHVRFRAVSEETGCWRVVSPRAPSTQWPPSLTTAAVIHAGSGVFGTICTLTRFNDARSSSSFGSRLCVESGSSRRLPLVSFH